MNPRQLRETLKREKEAVKKMKKEKPDVFEAIELNQNKSFNFFIEKAKKEGWNAALDKVIKTLFYEKGTILFIEQNPDVAMEKIEGLKK